MNRELKPLVDEAVKILAEHRNDSDAFFMSKYMKNKFAFLGIKKPFRKELTSDWERKIKSLYFNSVPELSKMLWEKEEREFQYIALDLLCNYVKESDIDFIHDIESFIVTKSWWDTVDLLASNVAGVYFRKYPQLIDSTVREWSQNPNMWLNRTSVLFQLKYKQQTDTELLKQVILAHAHSGEFFLQKAIGWALREYAKTDAEFVKSFLAQYELKPLSRREASKHL